jgi:hypothetical protein
MQSLKKKGPKKGAFGNTETEETSSIFDNAPSKSKSNAELVIKQAEQLEIKERKPKTKICGCW